MMMMSDAMKSDGMMIDVMKNDVLSCDNDDGNDDAVM